MLTNECYQPINCDDYDHLEFACQKHWTLSMELRDGEQLSAEAKDMISRKNVEYLKVSLSGKTRELRLDHIASFSHPEIGTVMIGEAD